MGLTRAERAAAVALLRLATVAAILLLNRERGGMLRPACWEPGKPFPGTCGATGRRRSRGCVRLPRPAVSPTTARVLARGRFGATWTVCMVEFDREIRTYYERGEEASRLDGGLPSGPLEFARTQESLARYLDDQPSLRVLDVGGAALGPMRSGWPGEAITSTSWIRSRCMFSRRVRRTHDLPRRLVTHAP